MTTIEILLGNICISLLSISISLCALLDRLPTRSARLWIGTVRKVLLLWCRRARSLPTSWT